MLSAIRYPLSAIRYPLSAIRPLPGHSVLNPLAGSISSARNRS
ncbi:hypothetical protein [Sodalis glossinidius]|nr:hypothetical protein [Sodalis glossinidius]